MRRPPRAPDAPLFGAGALALSLLQGSAVLLASSLMFWLIWREAGDPALARAMTFATIVLSSLGLILANRAARTSYAAVLKGHNPAFWAVCAGTLAGLGAVLYWTPASTLFRLAPLTWGELASCIAVVVAAFAVVEGLPRLYRRHGRD